MKINLQREFEIAEKENKKVLLDFTAEWCSTCKMMDKTIEGMKNELQSIKLVKVDVNENENIAEEFKVLSIPCLILCSSDKNIILKKNGFLKKEEIRKLVE